MEKSEAAFEKVKQSLLAADKQVNEGTMMGLPGIQYKGKNFAFLYKNGNMCFRLGKDFEPTSEGIHEFSLLNPFKNKPPMKDWFIIGPDYANKWTDLAGIALQHFRK